MNERVQMTPRRMTPALRFSYLSLLAMVFVAFVCASLHQLMPVCVGMGFWAVGYLNGFLVGKGE